MHSALNCAALSRSTMIAILLVSVVMPCFASSQEAGANVPTPSDPIDSRHAQSWLDAGDRAQAGSHLQEAIENYDHALLAFRALRDRSGEATVLNHIGVAYRYQSRYMKAIGYFESALAIHREIGDRAGQGTTLNNLGAAYRSLSQYATAIDFYAQALAIARETDDHMGEGITLNNLGEAYRSLSQYAKAIEFYEQALAIDRAVGNRAGTGTTLSNLGGTYYRLGQYSKAIGLYEQALATASDVGDHAGRANVLNNLGEAYRSLSEYAKAIGLFERALAIRREIGDRAGEGTTLHNLGFAYRSLSQNAKAIGLYEQALTIRREVGDRAGEGTTLNNLGAAYVALGRHAQAMGLYAQALTIRREINDRAGQGTTLNNLGAVYDALNRPTKAISLYEQALLIRREVGDRFGEAATLNNLGEAYRTLKHYAKAFGMYEQALAIDHEIGNSAGEAKTLSNLMETLVAQQRQELAVLFGKQSVNAYQKIRQGLTGLDKDARHSYLAANDDIYRRLADLLLAQDRVAEAQQVLNLVKEEEFFDFVRRDADQTSPLVGGAELTPTEAEWDRRYNEVADTLTSLGHERGQLVGLAARTIEQEKRLVSLEHDLRLAGEAFQKFLSRLEEETTRLKLSKEKLDQVKDSEALMGTLRGIGSNTVAVYTLVTEDKLRLILMTPDVMKTTETAVRRIDLNSKIVAFRERLQSRQSDPRPLARELYKLIVGPIERDLVGAKAETVMWSLDGALRYLPVAALHDGEHYLVERFRNVVFTPASSSHLNDAPAAQWRVLGLGVSKAHKGFRALPGAKKELEGIIRDEVTGTSGMLNGAIRLDDAFTRRSMLEALRQGYPVVHIASHFQFKPGDETASYLLLGDGEHMTLAEVGTMVNPFRGVDLLILSACDTASGGIANGNEVEGFAVLAQRKGAKAVIATLWPVADSSTNELMQAFYRTRGTKSGLTKVEALQTAQVALLHGNVEHRHPYYWAPFILIGNSR